MIYDKNFLRKLDYDRNRVVYAQITALSFDERPLQKIEGTITTGSINIDGASALRRSFSLTMTAKDINLSDYYWGLNTKIKLAVGLENHIDDQYPNIIWFEQGIYVITNFSHSHSTSNYTINISGKDKMCLLDGSVSGQLNSNVDFGKYEQEEKSNKSAYGEKSYRVVQQEIKNIIREAVHQFAGEPFHNIIITDLPDIGLVLQEYRYNKPLYLWRKIDDTKFLSGTIDDNAKVFIENKEYALNKLPVDFVFDPLNSFLENEISKTEIAFNSNPQSSKYYLAKIDAGETVGYKQGLLVYPDDLIGSAGSTIVAMLDKIKSFLGNFEYFYDIDGRFIFQKKKTYDSETWVPFQNTSYEISTPKDSQYSYEFTDSSLFTSFNYTPNLLNVKNDFTVWGNKSSINGAEIPIHMRLAIDKKPFLYKTIEVSDEELSDYNSKYDFELKGQKSHLYIVDEKYAPKQEPDSAIFMSPRYILLSSTRQASIYYDTESQILKLQIKGELGEDDILHLQATGNYDDKNQILTIQAKEYTICDWREIIYQMAKDYDKYNHLDNFELKVAAANPLMPSGKTGYEQYYIDLEGFWRTLYNPITNITQRLEAMNSYTREEIKIKIEQIEKQLVNLEKDDQSFEILYKELKDWEEKLGFYEDNDVFYHFTYTFNNDGKKIYKLIENDTLYWARAIIENPSDLIFWFDFLDTNGDLSRFSVPALGSRPKVENDKNVKAIAYLDTPEILLGESEVDSSITQNYTVLQLGSYEDMVVKSAQGKSAKETIDNLMFNYTYCAESVSINSIPIYYLQPNTRIYIKDEDSGVVGDYILGKINLSLAYNGTMSLMATKAPPILI